MSNNKNFYVSMSDSEKAIYEDYCNTLGLDLENNHSFALWFEFKKSGLSWF